MTHPQQTTREVIEQLMEALDHCMGAITERGLNGSPDQAEKWGLQLPLERAYAALAAGQQALEQTQVEAEPEWNDENVIAYCIARGISAAKAFTTGATQPKVEPAPKRCGLCGDCDAKAQSLPQPPQNHKAPIDHRSMQGLALLFQPKPVGAQGFYSWGHLGGALWARS